MRLKKRGFTLIELITVLSISAVLITISLNWYIKNVVSAGNNNNKNIDLQSGVSSSMEMIKNTLRKSTQTHLVGKNVFDPDLSIDQLQSKGLDKNYNYIAMYKDQITGEKILANVVYSKKEDKFNVIPLIASNKDDALKRNLVSYSMEIYKDEANYDLKMQNNIINVNIKGVSKDMDASGKVINSPNDKTFELAQDIYLPNINQILISKHLTGKIDEVTAIAYDNAVIEPGRAGNVTDMTFVFMLDMSGSMIHNKMQLANGSKATRLEVAKKSALKFIEGINKLGLNNKIKIKAYIYAFGSRTDFEIRLNTMKDSNPYSDKYIYDLGTLAKYAPQYGPYNLGKDGTDLARALSYTKGRMEGTVGNTNTGEGILQGLDILNNEFDKNPNEKRFFIVITDGQPWGYTFYAHQRTKVINFKGHSVPSIEDLLYSTEKYKEFKSNFATEPTSSLQYYFQDNKGHLSGGTLYSMEYVKLVTDPENNNNLDETFSRAYLIGFSDRYEDKSRLGISAVDSIPPPNSIREYLSRSKSKGKNGKKSDVHTLDATNDVSLDSAFENIIKDIAVSVGVFDGPEKLH